MDLSNAVMPGFMPGISSCLKQQKVRRGWPGHRRAKRRRSSNGYAGHDDHHHCQRQRSNPASNLSFLKLLRACIAKIYNLRYYLLDVDIENLFQGRVVMAGAEKRSGISFQLSPDQAAALKTIGGERSVRIAGRLVGNEVHVDFVAW